MKKNKFTNPLNNPQIKNILTALSFAVIVLAFCAIVADLLYQTKPLLKKGYVVDMTEKNQNIATSAGASAGAGAKEAAAPIDIRSLLKTADVDAGARIFKKCAACHTIEKGAGNKIGPNLYGVVGRARGSIAGFQYSAAMKAKGGSWSYEELNEFLTKPSAYISGTKMTFAGLSKDKDRANVISYLEKMGK